MTAMNNTIVFIKKIFHSPIGLWLFTRELFASPSHIGAAVPSSKFLAKAMAAQLPDSLQGVIVELGGGTGAITRALLEYGINPEKIIVVERSKALCKHLWKRFPNLSIIHGDAVDLKELLSGYDTPVSAVVSGLPLRSLPKKTVEKIKEALQVTLTPDAPFIQFTYDLLRKNSELHSHLDRVHSIYVWRNIPPARIDIYKLKSLK